MHTKLATMAMTVITENAQIEKEKSAFNGHFKVCINIFSVNIKLYLYSALV